MGERKTVPMREVTNAELGLQLGQVVNAIFGNGREGMLARMARIEERLVVAADKASEAKDAADKAADKATTAADMAERNIGNLAVSVTKVTDAIGAHVATEHLAKMLKTKTFWAAIIIGYLVLHVAATYFPDLLNFVLTLVGLPHLPTP